MVRLKSKTQCPPDGFRFEEKSTRWKSWEANPQTLWDYRLLLSDVQKHRMANPRFGLTTEINAIDNEVEAQNAARILTIPGAEGYIIRSGGAEGGQVYTAPKAPSVAAAIVAKAKLLNAGHSLIQEWKSEGYNVVPQAESNRRAEICSRCPKNGDGGLERFFTLPMSNLIKRDIEELQGRDLVTSFDDRLGVCEACTCPLRVKVHCDLPLIQKHLLPEAKSELWSECWIK